MIKNKEKRKICVVTANRADLSRLETVLAEIQKHPKLELQLVVIGSHLLDKAGHTIDDIEKMGFPIQRRIFMEVAGENPTTMAKSVGLAMIELSTVFDHLQPDIVLTHGDRYESLAVGSTAALMNIHLGHIQGGEVSGSIDESIRHAITKMSHLHFVSTEQSRERVIKMGEYPDAVFNVGCPGTDVLLKNPAKNRRDTIAELNKTIVKTKQKLDLNRPYILVIQHPVTTEHELAEKHMTETLEALKDRKEQLIIVWPNIDAGSEALSRTLRRHPVAKREDVKLFKHLPSSLFPNVLRNASCLLGNSSSGIREACYFGTPVVNIGSRQEGREKGSNVVDVSYNKMSIKKGLEKQITHGHYGPEYLYGNGKAGKMLTEICASCELPNIQKRIAY